MRRSRFPLSYALGLVLAVLIVGSAHWIGFRRGVHSARSTNGLSEASVPTAQTRVPNPLSSTEIEAENANPESSRQNADAEQAAFDARIDHLAHALSPKDALALIDSSSESDQEKKRILRALVAESVASSSHLTAEESVQWHDRIRSISGRRFGLEVELAMALASAPIDPGIAQAWMDAHADHPGRSKMFASLLADTFETDPLAVLRKSSAWTPWEQSRFEEYLFEDWARNAPDAALDWYVRNREAAGELIGQYISDAISQADPKVARNLLSSIQDPDQRRTAIENIASNLARIGTEDAIEWIDTLPNEDERNAALAAVYHATPRGIGAVMGREDGYPLIQDLIAGGPLEASGLAPGDMIVQTRETGGEPLDLYGLSMGEIVQRLRGEPGSDVEIRVLRQNPDTAQLEELQVRVIREVLEIPSRKERG